MDRQRCKVIANVQGHEFGVSLGPGAEVDLDEIVGRTREGCDVRLREVVDAAWFEPVEAETVPFVPPADEPDEE